MLDLATLDLVAVALAYRAHIEAPRTPTTPEPG